MKHILLVSFAGFFDSTAEIPYMFKKAGCTVDIYCSKESWLRTNCYHDNWIEASTNESTFVSEFISYVKENTDRYAWIILLEDPTVKILNECITDDELFKKIMPINKPENRSLLSSKIGLSDLCRKYEIYTPGYINFSENSDINDIKSKLHFPILLKEDFSFSGTGIQLCDNEALLSECISKVSKKENLVLQEFINGEDIGVEALFKDGKLIMYNVAEVLTYMYNRFSFTTRRNYYQDERIAEHLRKMGKAFGLNSFASIQYVYHKERNIFYLIEVDCRTNMWMPYSRFTSQNFSDGIKKYLSDDLFSVKPAIKDEKFEVTIFDRDIRRCINHRDYKGIWQWMTNYHHYWKFIPFQDLRLLKRTVGKIFKDFFFKLLNR